MNALHIGQMKSRKHQESGLLRITPELQLGEKYVSDGQFPDPIPESLSQTNRILLLLLLFLPVHDPNL